MSTGEVIRDAASLRLCILPAGSKRGILFPAEVLEWLQSEAISWTVRGDHERITFTIPDEIERMLFKLRFAHLRAF